MTDEGDLAGLDAELAADRLDDAELVEAADPGGMLRQVASSAAQVRSPSWPARRWTCPR